VGNEYSYKGNEFEPYVVVDKFDRSFKSCSNTGCTLYLGVDVSIHNPTDKYLKTEVKCTYYWGNYEHGTDISALFSLAAKKSRNIKFSYMMSVPYNVTSKVGVSCNANYVRNNDDYVTSISRGFDSSVIKIHRTKKHVVWATITIPSYNQLVTSGL
jgi:hypothetical protein